MGARVDHVIARLNVCLAAGGPASVDLVQDALDCLERFRSESDLLARRNSLIVRAGLLTGARRNWHRAELLESETRAMLRSWPALQTRKPVDEPATVREALHAAHLCKDLPGSRRTFYRVLAAALTTDTVGPVCVSGDAGKLHSCPEPANDPAPCMTVRSRP